VSSIPVAITFDNMGNAADIGRGLPVQADPHEPGLRVGLPRVQQLLTELDLPATFFVEGWNALHHGDRIVDLLELGHEVALHGWVHEPWATLRPDQEEAILAAGKAALDTYGANVTGFRAPGGERTGLTLDLLADLGFTYDSSLGEVVEVHPPRGTVVLPFTWPGVDWWWYNRRSPIGDVDDWQAGWRDLLEVAHHERRPLVLIAHARVSAVDDDRAERLASILRVIAEDPRFTPVLMRDLASSTLAEQAHAPSG
jgi:peptidoglycan/xylan/chitin deacetylase (PgdA/CDA1 family)